MGSGRRPDGEEEKALKQNFKFEISHRAKRRKFSLSKLQNVFFLTLILFSKFVAGRRKKKKVQEPEIAVDNAAASSTHHDLSSARAVSRDHGLTMEDQRLQHARQEIHSGSRSNSVKGLGAR